MSGQNSGTGFSDLSDPNDPFYANPYDSDSSDVIVDAGFVTSLDRAVVDVFDESAPGGSLTFEQIGRGAYRGFTAAEARSIVDNPDQLAHLAVLWQLRPPPAPITASSVVDDPTGRWHRELQRRTQQHAAGVDRLRPLDPDPTAPEHEGRGRRWGSLLVAASVAAALVAAVLVGVSMSRKPTDISGIPSPTNSAGPSRALPKSPPLAPDQFVIPRGPHDQLQLYVASVNGGIAPRRLAGPADHRLYGASLSADRRSLIYIDDTEHAVRTMAVDGTGDRPLFDRLPSGCYGPGHVSLSPADESILIVQCVPKTGSSRLIVMTTDGNLVRRLPTGHVRVDDPSLSPDGRTVAYWASDVATGQTGGSIYTIGIDESAVPVALTDSAAGTDADPAWTPDGKSIAFRRSINDNWDVYQMSSDGSNVRPLVTGPNRDHKPAWSPDGKQLMIISNRDAKDQTDTSFDLYLANADGTVLKPLGFSGQEILTPTWWHR